MKPCLVLLTVLVIVPREARTATLFESGTLGPTGISWSDLTDGSIPSTSVNSGVLPGVRFQLSQRAITTRVGGHFVGPIGGSFFGVIVELDNENDFPDSIDLTSSDVLGHTLLSFSTSSAEVFGDLHLPLEPRWYALVFGSGHFDATSSGAAVRNGVDIDDPSYIAFEINGLDWFNLDKFGTEFDNHRFVVEGWIVPEPAAVGLITAALLSALSLLRIPRRR